MTKQIKIFVTGIGTDVGKTVVSAILTRALHADYWKPIQAGGLNNSDSNCVARLCPTCVIHPETYKLTQPMSPHAAAQLDKVRISLDDFVLPQTKNNLIVEGVGGLMVPLNNNGDTILDLIKRINIPVILVSKNYLGSINHTLLSVGAMRAMKINILGIVFNGEENKSTEKIIMKITKLPKILKIKKEPVLNNVVIEKYAKKIKV